MTRFELFMKIEQYKHGEISEMDMVSAAAAFEKALLQQTLFVSSSKRFKCRNCGARSVNSGAFFKGSNVYKDGRHCYKCEKAWAEQQAEDSAWYNSVRM